MQRLSGLDAMFLHLETPASHMHVTGVYVLEPGPDGLSFDAVRDLVSERLPLAPPLRRRLVEAPLRLGQPMWVEDPGFELDYHVRRACLPSPGGRDELADFAAHVGALPLDRSRPLWELYVVEGLDGGRLALVGKMHHAAIDGVSGAEIMASLLDLEPEPTGQIVVDTWRPDELPSDADVVALAVAAVAGHPVRAAKSVRRLLETALQVSERNRDPGTSAPPSPFSAPKTPLNGAITPHRRVALASHPLDELKLVKSRFGCTVNDVVLAACGGALRRHLLALGELPADPLVAMVPMSIRSDEEWGMQGNRLTAVLTSLATDVEEPVERLGAVAEGMRQAKAQAAVVGNEALGEWSELAFPALVGGVARLTSSMRVFDKVRPIFNVTISNIPGPPFPLFLGGARLVGTYPLGPVTEGIGLNITVMSYCGMVYFGFNGCRESVPAMADLPEQLRASLDELLVAAGRRDRSGLRAASPPASAGEAPAPPLQATQQ